MLSSGAYSIQDRKNRRAAVKKAALSSRISLLSGITGSSSGSSGSGSTITQESISRPRPRSSKSNVSSKGKRQRTATSSTSSTSSSTSTKERSSARKSKETKGGINVFEFLDKDQSRASLSQHGNTARPGGERECSKDLLQDESDVDSNPRSFHSDSGISINDTSSDHGSSNLNGFSKRLATLEENVSMHYNSTGAELRHRPKLSSNPQDVNEDHPEWYYWTDKSRDETCQPTEVEKEVLSGQPEAIEESHVSGYDLLASRLCSSQSPSENSLPPIYRRFENLNHRILLQLQDEIVEMEEDLQHMDRVDALERAAQQDQAKPASRRLDWQWRGSELHARRLELLGRIYLKVEQYNQALSSFQRVASSTSPALAHDIHKYREWMTENKPVAEAEAMYLDKEDDLLSLRQPNPTLEDSSHISSHQTTALMIAITSATALPILLFRIIPGATSRIVVLLLLIPSVAFIPKFHAIGSILEGKEPVHFLILYFGLLTLAALVI